MTSLGVIGALVKGEDSSEAIKYLVKTELIVLCLRIMKKGYEMSKTVSIFIVLKILLDNLGLDYVCRTDERLNAVANILKDMMDEMEKIPNEEGQDNKIVRQIIRCFLRLSENPKFANKSQCQLEEVSAEIADDGQRDDKRRQVSRQMAQTVT